MSSVECGTGYAHDLAALRDICQENELAFIVDASQSLGAFPLDINALKPDFAMASTYKWLLGGYGLSIFYVAPKWLEHKPPFAGWMSVAHSPVDKGLSLKSDASVGELGCPNFPTIFALGAAMDFFDALGPAVIEQRVRELAAYLKERLLAAGFSVASTRDAERKSGIIAIDVPNPGIVASQLIDSGVFVSAKGFGLRVSVYFYNSFEDIDGFIRSLRMISGVAHPNDRQRADHQQ